MLTLLSEKIKFTGDGLFEKLYLLSKSWCILPEIV